MKELAFAIFPACVMPALHLLQYGSFPLKEYSINQKKEIPISGAKSTIQNQEPASFFG